MPIYNWGGIFIVAPMIANSVLRAAGDAKRPAMLMSTAAVLNICIDPVLIFGLFGFPRMEIEGAALGGVIANFLTMCASIFFVMYRERLVNIRTLDTHVVGFVPAGQIASLFSPKLLLVYSILQGRILHCFRKLPARYELLILQNFHPHLIMRRL